MEETNREQQESEKQFPGAKGDDFVARWMKLTARPDRDADEPDLSTTYGELLYDEFGMPK